MAKETETADQKPAKSAGVKYFPDQFDNEEVLYVFRKHPLVMRKGLIWGSLGLLVGPLYTLILTYVHANNPPSLNFFYLSFLVSIGIAGLLFFPSWMSWWYSVFIVTDQRFIQITQKGFFHRSVVDMGLNQIQMVNYEVAGLQETLLGFGTIMMQTFVGDLVIHYIHKPAHIQKKLLEILRAEGVAVSDSPASQAANIN
ncbi:MAG TPA: PH domain-containing protein [Candidatus Saccharimonadales bacterium]|nr:PH domain-containing protein [Candidatus Saccharimonadales bacterium]